MMASCQKEKKENEIDKFIYKQQESYRKNDEVTDLTATSAYLK